MEKEIAEAIVGLLRSGGSYDETRELWLRRLLNYTEASLEETPREFEDIYLAIDVLVEAAA